MGNGNNILLIAGRFLFLVLMNAIILLSSFRYYEHCCTIDFSKNTCVFWGCSLLFLLCLSAFLISFCFVPIAKYIAQRLNILDVPDGKIKVHSKITPYLGGVAVYIGCLVPASIISFFFYRFLSFSDVFLLIGSTILLLVGLVDDIFILSPGQKLAGQCLALLFFLCGGFYLHIGICNYVEIILSGLWILTIINAFNLIDVMDGLSSITAIMSALGFLMIALYLGEWSISCILSLFIGSLAGFLCYNFPPASIYMGDTGSLFIGGLLAVLPFKLNFAVNTRAGYIIPIILLAIPLLEITALVVIRAYKKIPFYNGSPDHFSLYLQQHGWPKIKILKYICAMMSMLIVSAYGIVAGFFSIYQIILLAIIFLFIWFYFLIYGSIWQAQR